MSHSANSMTETSGSSVHGRQEYWGSPCPSPGHLPNLGSKPTSAPALAWVVLHWVSWASQMIKPDLKGYILCCVPFTWYSGTDKSNRSVVIRNGEGFDTRDIEEFFVVVVMKYSISRLVMVWLHGCVFVNTYKNWILKGLKIAQSKLYLF